jgi:lysozyme
VIDELSPETRIVGRLAAGAVLLSIVIGAAVLPGRGSFPFDRLAPAGRLSGVDVSSHNPPYDWAAAARSGLRFVVARATEGDSRTDERYAAVKRGARAAGLAFTAFHFARPDRNGRDAIVEADYFLRAAGLGPGNLVPILDLETSGGLPVTRLQTWVRAWLEEVTTRLGARPMIYTNAAFWQQSMGDTTSFAEAGYRLAIASWGGTSPVVPAGNWGGRGWTLWQTSNCGRVAGIPGCIDTEVYDGSDLKPLTIS